MSSDQVDAQREAELHREAVRLAIRELHGSTAPLERRLRDVVQQRITGHSLMLDERLQRFMPEVIVQGMPEPYQSPSRPRFGLMFD